MITFTTPATILILLIAFLIGVVLGIWFVGVKVFPKS
jgi:uncharacterized protein YneF (UPF0154 family)